ncbi:unnamed protein product [Cuscuta europaea]|uniref:Uncharacterized protein n=1 Tax=Cuscuta europaea TaxID=41803 RepID=A0A9P0ZW65_CUSEU|nr:unnamed protein product [Cuscuta europaea]
MASTGNACSLLMTKGQHPFSSLRLPSTSPRILFCNSFKPVLGIEGPKPRAVYLTYSSLKDFKHESEVAAGKAVEDEVGIVEPRPHTLLYSFPPSPWLLFAALPGDGSVRSMLGPFVELVKTWNLPEWVVHWGHPGNMAVVLIAMGGYGTYLGFRIRSSNDVEERAKAKDLHPKLLAGMFFFFALGATGGIISLLTSDKPILESPHAVTAFLGLALLTIQTLLPALFEDKLMMHSI